jgi:hypothetical protein
MDFSKTSTTTTTVAVPPTFSASMARDAPLGALIAIGLGFVLLLVQMAAFPEVNLNQWMITALSNTAGESGVYISAVLNIPITTDTTSPFYFLQFIYGAFLSFPANISWFVGALIVGFLRVRRGRDEGNLRAGWDTYWYALVSIEIPFIIFGIIMLLTFWNPVNAVVAAFSGSLLLYFLLFFLMPMFWLGLIFSLLGSIIGSLIAKRMQ